MRFIFSSFSHFLLKISSTFSRCQATACILFIRTLGAEAVQFLLLATIDILISTDCFLLRDESDLSLEISCENLFIDLKMCQSSLSEIVG